MTAPEQQAAPEQADLRQRILEAQHAIPHAALSAQWPTSTGLVAIEQTDAVLAVVEPELDRLRARGDLWKAKAAEMEQDRDRLDAELAALREQLAAAEKRAEQWEQARDAEVLATTRVFDEYYRHWQSTVVEARRQARRAETAEQALAQVAAWAHIAIFHHGGPACPYPGTCTVAASLPTT